MKNGIILFLIVIIFILFSCGYSMKLKKYTRVIINNKIILSNEEIDNLEKMASNLKKTKREIYDQPEIFLRCYKNDKIVKTIAIFNKEGIIYYGNYLKAFMDRMEGRSSSCFIMSEELNQYLSSLLKNE